MGLVVELVAIARVAVARVALVTIVGGAVGAMEDPVKVTIVCSDSRAWIVAMAVVEGGVKLVSIEGGNVGTA